MADEDPENTSVEAATSTGGQHDEESPEKNLYGEKTTDDASADGHEQAQISKRESIRAKLREREQRLTSLVRTTSGDGENSFLGQMRSVQQKMQEVEEQKSALEKELMKLQTATDGDDFLKEKMAGIQEGFMKQVKVIQNLEDEVLAKNNEIEHLRDELVTKLRRIVELEFDLETHDVHYTDYAAEQFKLGEEALAEIKAMEKEGSHDNEASDGDPNKLSPRRAQKLISKLLADLDNLEARYKEEKLENSEKMGKVVLRNNELRTRIHVLESRLGDREDPPEDESESSTSSADKMNIAFLRKRVETLEAKRAIYREEVRELHKQVSDIKKGSQDKIKVIESGANRLKLENEAMKSRINALETGIMDSDPTRQQFAEIESQIAEKSDAISKMAAEIDIKDRQIDSLKKDITKLRIRDIAKEGENQGENTYSALDADLLRQDIRKDQQKRSSGGEGVDASYVQELQRQLQSAQQQLVKKDQELVIERAKAASTAAGLLARITELTARQREDEDSTQSSSKNKDKGNKKDGKKKRPLRFYL